uniref:Uncharacterized mitochondrial protein AtMg00810-like n=1 Tax=Nicotiana tabacum TaxID=4097 RepID=A0A1S4A9W6_TOBAC|nr:PREDICTED: uncharacterized mitochondrial protein AtMg00810-like [Nicotiana tabacum]
MSDCKSAKTPMSNSNLLKLNDGVDLTDATRYCRVPGRLQYLSFTRPYISYAVNKLSQFMQSPSDLYWKAVKRVLRSSTSSYILFLDRNLISWSSKKQKIVARSSTEAEYRVVANALAELLW